MRPSGRLFDAIGRASEVLRPVTKAVHRRDAVKPDSGTRPTAVRRVPARWPSSGACSSTTRGPIGLCTPRRGASGSTPRERALATRLAYGDRPAPGHARPPDRGVRRTGRSRKLEPLVLAALRLGLYQLAFLDRVPAHAAVGESVELVKRDSPRGAGLVNAVLRRGAREAAARVAALPDATPAQAALRHSHPEWIAALWFDALGPDAGPRADGRRQRARRGRAAREHAARRRRRRSRPALPVAHPPRARPARGAGPRRPVRRVRLAAVARGPLHAAVARGDDGRRACSARARASACSTCAPRPAARRRTSRR